MRAVRVFLPSWLKFLLFKLNSGKIYFNNKKMKRSEVQIIVPQGAQIKRKNKFDNLLFYEKLAGCGMLRTRWRPTRGLASLRSAHSKKYLNPPPKKTQKFAQKVPQKVPQKDPAPSWAIWRKFGFFSFFKIIPPLGGVNPKKVFRGYPQIPGGAPCQIWLRSIQ